MLELIICSMYQFNVRDVNKKRYFILYIRFDCSLSSGELANYTAIRRRNKSICNNI